MLPTAKKKEFRVEFSQDNCPLNKTDKQKHSLEEQNRILSLYTYSSQCPISKRNLLDIGRNRKT